MDKLLPKPLRPSLFPFRNLVFQGGGVKAYVYHGVLRVLDERGILPRIERVAGTSAGALQAAMLCLRLGVEETIDLYRTVDYSRLRSLSGEAEEHSSLLSKTLDPARAAGRFLHKFGVYSTAYMLDWLHQTIAEHCQGNARATFADFRRLGFRDLYTMAANLNRHRVETFSADTTPDVAVADAVLLSAAVPFFFEALQFDGHSIGQGDYYADGGTLSNYPLTIFDGPRFKKTSKSFTYGVNWETLGLQLYTPEECGSPRSEIGSLLGYAENLFETMGNAQAVAVDLRAVDRWRSLRISNCCVSTVDFQIQPQESDAKYLEMVATGRQAAEDYLDAYRDPTDRLAGVKARLAEILDSL